MFLFLNLLVVLTTSDVYTFGNQQVTINTVLSGPIANSSSGDECKKVIARPMQIYHLSSQGKYESWFRGSFTTPHLQKDVLPGSTIYDFDVDPREGEVHLVTSTSSKTYLVYFINSNHQIWSIAENSFFVPVRRVMFNYPNAFIKTTETFFTRTAQFSKLNYGALQQTILKPLSWMDLTLPPDYSICLIWDEYSNIQVLNASTWTEIQTINPTNTPGVTGSTQMITFSQDSAFAIIETDTYNPIVIMNLTNFQVEYSISINQVINKVHFINESNTHIIVFGVNSTILVDLTNGNQYALPLIPAVDSDVDYNNNIFTCHANIIRQINISEEYVPSEGQSGNSQFFFDIELSDSQQAAYEIINKSLTLTIKATNLVSSVASSFPLSIYFLSFLNYFTLSSLYVLVNFPIPRHIYESFAQVYKQLNFNILSTFGVEVKFKPLSEEKVDGKRAAFFEIESDLFSSQSFNFFVLVSNIILIFFLQWVFSFLKKSNYIRKTWSKQKWVMVSGHVVNIIMPLTLPWSFIILQNGVRNINTKLNAACYIILFFLGLFFPIYYFFELLQERQSELIEERNKIRRENQKKKMKMKEQRQKLKLENKQIKQVEKKTELTKEEMQKQRRDQWKVKFFNLERRKKRSQQKRAKAQLEAMNQKKVETLQKNKHKDKNQNEWLCTTKADDQQLEKEPEVTFSKLFSFDLVQQWYLSQANFLYPSLVLLQNPVFFLVAIQAFTFLGIVIAFKKQTMRINSFILAIYPFIFHLSFMFFYWSKSVQVLVVAQFLCLTSYFIGIVHNLLTIVAELFIFVIDACKSAREENKITPSLTKSKKIIIEQGKEKTKNQSKSKNQSKIKQKSKSKPKPGSKTQNEKKKTIEKLSKDKPKERTEQTPRRKPKKELEFDKSKQMNVQWNPTK